MFCYFCYLNILKPHFDLSFPWFIITCSLVLEIGISTSVVGSASAELRFQPNGVTCGDDHDGLMATIGSQCGFHGNDHNQNYSQSENAGFIVIHLETTTTTTLSKPQKTMVKVANNNTITTRRMRMDQDGYIYIFKYNYKCSIHILMILIRLVIGNIWVSLRDWPGHTVIPCKIMGCVGVQHPGTSTNSFLLYM